MELRSRFQTLSKYGSLVADYLLHAKTISNHLVVVKKHLVLYILNGLGSWYFPFVTTFNMTRLRSSVGVLHNQLDSCERMMLAFEGTIQDSIF